MATDKIASPTDRRAYKKLPSEQKLRELFLFDEHTGELRWRNQTGTRSSGVAGHIAKDGYRKVHIGNIGYGVHRLVWVLVHGSAPLEQIDHIDRNRSNNAPSNLRLATTRENAWNRSVAKNNTSGFPGVRWSKETNTWELYIQMSGFKTAEEAAELRAWIASMMRKQGYEPNQR